MSLKEKITSETALETVAVVFAVFLILKVFEPILTVAFYVAIGVGVYLLIRNRETLKQKWANLKEYIKSAR